MAQTKAEKAAYNRKWRLSNKERLQDYEKSPKRKASRRVYMKRYGARWAKANPEKRKEVEANYRKRRQALIDILKSEPCTDCGKTFLPCAMDFDHVRGKKKASIKDLTNGASMEALLAEIRKCELVCSNCHRIRTWTRRSTRGSGA